ncbi:YciI family protein [Streptomyces sp. NBC_00878]|uniref:YciI family protein n=1 Tax=Streptomyces sp. NBC_00878 TaxID=2975854 RepID=UPI00224F5C04|nr:YciI family protein [Streptomyces sp. NBC_00878]MCX4905521.1 YciI family protein [Streptomyces sp. NBC_00878]
MKYLLMIQGTQADYAAQTGKPSDGAPAWTEQDIQTMYAHMGAINNDLAETGEMIDGQGLTEPAKARFVERGPDGKPVITDGPYGETKEVLAGYWVLDCASLDRVTEIAARVLECPVPEGTKQYPLVIRQIGDGSGDV